MRKLQACLLGGALLLGCVGPAGAQNDRRDYQNRDNTSNHQGHDNYQGRNNYYSGMNDHVRGGDYGHAVQRDENEHHHDSGGIGPGKGALIGGAGGAVLGAIFGGGLKGSLIGGAAGAGIGALGAKLAEGNNDHRDRDHR